MSSEAHRLLLRNTPEGRASISPLIASSSEIDVCVQVNFVGPAATEKRGEQRKHWKDKRDCLEKLLLTATMWRIIRPGLVLCVVALSRANRVRTQPPRVSPRTFAPPISVCLVYTCFDLDRACEAGPTRTLTITGTGLERCGGALTNCRWSMKAA